MNAIDVNELSFSFGSARALDRVSFTVPRGAFYALLGPNGAGKSTLLHILMGLRQPRSGSASVLGRTSSTLRPVDKEHIGYVAEGQKLPGWMRLEQLEAYLAPWYPTWDVHLANELRDRFELDRHRKIAEYSRGQCMKTALLCALAPRPQLLLMDEPFTGMDAVVKEDLVRGLLDASASEDCTVLLSSHDIDEIEMLADWVGFLHGGRMTISQSVESAREQYQQVDVLLADEAADARPLPAEWMGVERAGRRLTFVVAQAHATVEQAVRTRLPDVLRVEWRAVSLKELFIAMQRSRKAGQDALPVAGQAP